MTTFTRTSPAGGTIPAGATEVGGIVLDMVGTNGVRVTAQLAASSLYIGFSGDGTPVEWRGNPMTFGIQTNLAAGIAALGGGLAALSVRITLFDGDTAINNFDYLNQNFLQLNGVELDDFSTVYTQATSSDGLTLFSTMYGFADETLCTGWFNVTNAAKLAEIYNSIAASGQLRYAVRDTDPGDNRYDFRQGVDGGLIDVGQPPNISPTAGNDSATTPYQTAVTINIAANDFDPDGTITAYALGTPPSHGMATLNGDRTVTYTPSQGFVGTDTFTYQITDDRGETDTAVVTVTVSPEIIKNRRRQGFVG